MLLHRSEHDPLPDVEVVLARNTATGSKVLVLSTDSGQAGYDTRPEEAGWKRLLVN